MENKTNLSSNSKSPTKNTLVDGLSVRSILIGLLGGAFISASSIYVALKMGALPWPIVFASILSFTLLKLMGNTNLSEVNVAHTTMSAGAMVAGGIAFTIPGIWILNPETSISWIQVVVATLIGVAIGLVCSYLLRPRFIDEQVLPYPMGQASAQTLIASDAGGKDLSVLGGSLGFAAIYTFLRDKLALIPPVFFGNASILGVPLAVYASPMMMSVGYLLGGLAALGLIVGALVGFLGIASLAVSSGVFTADHATFVRSSLGIGLMLGSGLGVIITSAIRLVKSSSQSSKNSKGIALDKKGAAIILIIALIAVASATACLHINLLASIVLIALCAVAVIMALQSVGETSIDPMEVFAVIMVMILRVIWDIQVPEAFFLTCVVAVAAGLAGDTMSDFKAGRIIGTTPKSQFIGEIFGALFGAAIAIGVLYLLVKGYGTNIFGADKEFVAVQASVVASMIGGSLHLKAMILGLVIGVALHLLKVPAITLGLGVYLPLHLTLAALVGALIKVVLNKFAPKFEERYGVIVASGLLGGEAIVGVIIALVMMLGAI